MMELGLPPSLSLTLPIFLLLSNKQSREQNGGAINHLNKPCLVLQA